MAQKTFELNGGLAVTITKRRASRSIRLSITAAGDVRISMPLWLPYKAGLVFAESRYEWIVTQRTPPSLLLEGQPIGKTHRLHFRVSAKANKPSSRITADLIIITHPLSMSVSHHDVQALTEKAAIRALRQEAVTVLPPRLNVLATRTGYQYTDVRIKQLTRRWGSCDQHRHIALNLFLMQLPWELIDYVLLHELVHTEHLHHGPDFWAALEAVAPGAKTLRDQIRKHKPVVVR